MKMFWKNKKKFFKFDFRPTPFYPVLNLTQIPPLTLLITVTMTYFTQLPPLTSSPTRVFIRRVSRTLRPPNMSEVKEPETTEARWILSSIRPFWELQNPLGIRTVSATKTRSSLCWNQKWSSLKMIRRVQWDPRRSQGRADTKR